MSGIQTIIDSCQTMEFDRRRIVGQSISRSQRTRVAERTSAQPWTFKVTPKASWSYSSNRDLIESITLTDRFSETEINLANNTKLQYLTSYQGKLTNTQLSALTVTNFVTATMTVSGLPAIGGTDKNGSAITSSTVIFAAGDFIQPNNSRYPYTVTAPVLRGSTSTVSIITNRPRITSEAVTITGPLKIGNNVTWRMVIAELPTFQLVPYNRFQWTGDFSLIEKVI